MEKGHKLESLLISQGDIHSEDPFNIYDILDKKQQLNHKISIQSEGDPKFPPGFTPHNSDGLCNQNHVSFAQDHDSKNVIKEDGCSSVNSGSFKQVNTPKTGGSMLQLIEDLIKETKMENVNLFDIRSCWGNLSFDFVVGPSVVRFEAERFGFIFNARGAAVFNSFISSSGLVEVPSGGYSFTWAHKSATKMSKLDRFLISEALMRNCPNISSITLDRFLSDHRPILLREICLDYGPTPFRFFHHWFGFIGFDSFVFESWKDIQIQDQNAMLNFAKKLKILKGRIRSWVKDEKEKAHVLKNSLKKKLADIDPIVDKGEVTSDVLEVRLDTMNSLTKLENMESIELAQKAKIKWSIEGDENSKYFHDIMNKKRNNLAIKGIIVDGEWIEDPNVVKNEFLSHFRNRFDSLCNDRLTLDMVFPNVLSHDQAQDLEKAFLKDEIKQAVWDCGLDKSPGPDGFTFCFYRKFWSLLKDDVVDAVCFFIPMASVLKGVGLDNSLQLSHLFYADDVVFIGQWSACWLFETKTRIANAAHYLGCKILKTPFSYLGVNIGGNMTRINSWDVVINKTLSRLSKWKLKVLSIGGRLTLLKYDLGSISIYYMSMFRAPIQVINKLESIRSHFFNGVDHNVRKMSFVNWKNVLASKEKGGLGVSSFFALNRALIFKWVWRFRANPNSLWSRAIRAIHGFDGKLGNPHKPSFSSNWIDIVRAIHRLKQKSIDLHSFVNKKVGNGVHTYFWEDSWRGETTFKTLFPRIYALEKVKDISVAEKMAHPSISFSFRREPRSGSELSQMTSLQSHLEGILLPNMTDRWVWSLSGDGEFSVSSARKLIDDKTLGMVGSKTNWCKFVPIKVNILSWRVKLIIFPNVLIFLEGFGELLSIFCPSCNMVVESTNHIFFACSMMNDLYKPITSWWDIKALRVSSYEEWWSWFSSLRLSHKIKMVLQGVFYITWWLVWKYRNQLIFGPSTCFNMGRYLMYVALSFFGVDLEVNHVLV
ncbi:RNA-directed DNA polymerase, eukaryota, reverse transcriptase zinc-binding domain protein [Tanacetum coccineum]